LSVELQFGSLSSQIPSVRRPWFASSRNEPNARPDCECEDPSHAHALPKVRSFENSTAVVQDRVWSGTCGQRFDLTHVIVSTYLALRKCVFWCVDYLVQASVLVRRRISSRQAAFLIAQTLMLVMSTTVICVAAFVGIEEQTSPRFAYIFACVFVFFAGALANCESFTGIPML
jgi:hypothetical protein